METRIPFVLRDFDFTALDYSRDHGREVLRQACIFYAQAVNCHMNSKLISSIKQYLKAGYQRRKIESLDKHSVPILISDGDLVQGTINGCGHSAKISMTAREIHVTSIKNPELSFSKSLDIDTPLVYLEEGFANDLGRDTIIRLFCDLFYSTLS